MIAKLQGFLSSSNLKTKIGLNTLYQVLGRFITASTGLLATKLIISHLGLTGFGNYQIAITYVTIFWLLTDFGLNAVVVREMSAKPEREEELFGSLLSLRACLSLFLAVISASVLYFFPYSKEIKLAILVGIGTILTQGIKGAVHGLFQTRLRYELQFVSDLFGSIVFLGSLYLALQTLATTLSGVTTIGLVGAFLTGQVATMLTTVFFAARITSFHFNLDLTELKRLFIITIPFGLSLLFNLANFKVDALLLSVLHINAQTNTVAVGIYNLAYKFFEFGLIFPTFFMNAVYPVMVKAHEESFRRFKKVLGWSGIVLLTSGLMAVVFTFLLAPWAISLVANLTEFTDSVTVLRLLMLFAPIFFTSSLLMWVVLTFKDQRFLIWVYGVAFILNITLNLVMIPKFSYFGAAITTGVSEFLILGLLAWRVYKKWPR